MQCGFRNGENARCILYVCTFFHTGARRHNVHILAGTLSRHILHTFTAPPFFAFFSYFLKKCIHKPDTGRRTEAGKKCAHWPAAVCFVLYASMLDAMRQKVYTQARPRKPHDYSISG